MHRNDLIRQLEIYQEKWKDEAPTVQRFIDFITSNEDCFESLLKAGHITSSAWLVNNDGTRVLLTHHKKLNKWIQLGGHADGDSDVCRSALREAREESGLENVELLSPQIFDMDIHDIPSRPGEAAHLHYDIRYAMRAAGNEDYIVSDESHDLAWINVDDLAKYTKEESVLRMAAKWRVFKK